MRSASQTGHEGVGLLQGVQVPGEMLLAGAVGVARHPSPSSPQELASEGACYAQGSGKSTGCRLRGTTGGRGT